MSDMTFRGNGTLITHNNATYLPSPLMPGYCGHVPNAKFLYGETFGNSTIKYFQEVRRAAMASSASAYTTGGMFPSIHTSPGALVAARRSQCRDRALSAPYWPRYNVDFKRQREIAQFAELAQKHRGSYKDRTGTLQPVPFFSLPQKDPKQHTQWPVCLPHMKSVRSEGVRRYQTLPSGIRTTLNDRIMRNIFFERR
ncbi:ciliary microtubule inner protein 2C [Brachyhypopomus gauderio]|uniref:ciliary microtubule inner protein 2C n=1 Tax=Brachyhypopomus gauderio TaxID=698409 RepID=UPI0040436816